MDTPKASADIDQHNAEIHENLRHWQRKPALRAEYQRYYRLIADALNGVPDGPVLECGSGIGNLKSVLPQAITSDLFTNPWLDRRENVYALSFPDRSLSGVVLFDVFHHLEYPGTALTEIHRTLSPGGRLVIFEPAMGLLGRIVLGIFHHEPLGLNKPISWMAPENFNFSDTRYYAAQGNAWRTFLRKERGHDFAGFRLQNATAFPALAWLLTGGFRGPNVAARSLKPLVSAAEKLLGLAPTFFASRMLIRLDK